MQLVKGFLKSILVACKINISAILEAIRRKGKANDVHRNGLSVLPVWYYT